MTTKKNLLFITLKFDGHLPRSLRTENIVLHLKDKYNITVLCLNIFEKPKYISGIEIIRAKQSWLGKYIFNKSMSGFTPTGLTRIFSRGISFIFKPIIYPDVFILEKKEVLSSIDKSYSPDVIVSSLLPFSSALFAREIKRTFNPRAKIIFDIGDPYSHNSANSYSFNWIKRLYEKKIMAFSDAVIVTNDQTKLFYSKKLNVSPKKTFVIPQGVNLSQIIPSPKPDHYNYRRLSMIYAGTFYPGLREVHQFIQAINDLDSDQIEINFYGHQASLGFKGKRALIRQFPRIEQSKLFKKYNEANLLLYFDNFSGIQTSGKVYELLALKKPMLCIYKEHSAVVELLKSYPNVLLAEYNSDSIKSALTAILNGHFCGVAYDYNIEAFGWKNKSMGFENIINNLLR